MSYVILAVLSVCFLFVLLGCFEQIDVAAFSFKVMRKTILICAILLTGCVSLKSNSADLIRQFIEINELRAGGKEILLRDLEWSPLWGKYFLFYLVSLQKNNLLLITIGAFITYGIISRIRDKGILTERINSQTYATSLFLLTSLCTFVNVTNSVRFPMACAMVSYAANVFFDARGNKHHVIFSLILSVIALTIHQGAVILVVAALLAFCIRRQTTRFVLCIVGPLLASSLSSALTKADNHYLQYLGNSIQSYMEGGTLDSRSFSIACAMLSLLLCIMAVNYKNKDGINPYFNFVETLVFLSLGCIFLPIVSQRILVAVAINSLGFLNKTMKKEDWKSEILGVLCFVGSVIAIILLYYYDLYVFANVYTIRL